MDPALTNLDASENHCDCERRIEELESRVAALEDLLLTLSGSVQYREDKPYDALVARLMLTGNKRIELFVILRGLSDRLNGGGDSLIPGTLARQNAAVQEAYRPEPLSRAEAVSILIDVVGAANAEDALDAFAKQFPRS